MAKSTSNKKVKEPNDSIGALFLVVLLLIAAGYLSGLYITKIYNAIRVGDFVSFSFLRKQNGQDEYESDLATELETTELENMLTTSKGATAVPIVVDLDHKRGNANSRIAIVEYSDFECPFCKTFHTTLSLVHEEYKDEVLWVFRHFPLQTLHKNSFKEAEATECAASLGGNEVFWQMADKIFEETNSNDGLPVEKLPAIAQELNIDTAAFETCLSTGEMANTVAAHHSGGLIAGITSTPSVFIIDVETKEFLSLDGALPAEHLKKNIDFMLNR